MRRCHPTSLFCRQISGTLGIWKRFGRRFIGHFEYFQIVLGLDLHNRFFFRYGSKGFIGDRSGFVIGLLMSHLQKFFSGGNEGIGAEVGLDVEIQNAGDDD